MLISLDHVGAHETKKSSEGQFPSLLHLPGQFAWYIFHENSCCCWMLHIALDIANDTKTFAHIAIQMVLNSKKILSLTAF